MGVRAENFNRYDLGYGEVVWGVFLLLWVTFALATQAFWDMGAKWHNGGIGTDAWSNSDLRYTVFGVHCATVLFVIGDAFRFNGVKAFYAHFTIGSGLFATLGQVALVAIAANQEAFQLSLIALALQCYANALMLAFIFADLRRDAGYDQLT